MEGLYEGQKIANLKHFLVTLEEYARGKGFQLAIARRSDYILIKCFCCGLHSDDMPLAVSQTQKKKGKKKKGKTKTETKEAAQKDQNTAEKAEVIRDKVNRWHVVLKLCYERKPLYNHLADAACTPRHALGDINSSDPNGKFGETFKTVEIEEDCGSRAGWSWHGYNIYSINMKHDRSGHDRCEKQCRRKASLSKAASPRSRKAISYCQTFSHCHAEPLDETHFDILPGLRMRKVIPFHAVSHELDAEDLERLGRLQKMKSRASSACAFCHQPISIEHARPNDSYEDVNEETDIIRYELGKHKLAKRTAYKDVSDLYVHRSCASWSALAEVYNDGTIDNVLSEVARSTKLHCHSK